MPVPLLGYKRVGANLEEYVFERYTLLKASRSPELENPKIPLPLYFSLTPCKRGGRGDGGLKRDIAFEKFS